MVASDTMCGQISGVDSLFYICASPIQNFTCGSVCAPHLPKLNMGTECHVTVYLFSSRICNEKPLNDDVSGIKN